MPKKFTRSFESAFRYFLPSPLSIALLLSFLAFLLVWFLGPNSLYQNFTKSIDYWIEGLWQAPLLVFMVQMMLILVLGHSLALSPPIKKIITRLLRLAKTPEGLSALVCFFSILVSLFNWGLGLVFGAIFARQAGLKLSQLNLKFNYGLLGAAGYSGLMVWHGGFSGMNIFTAITLLLVIPLVVYGLAKVSNWHKIPVFDSRDAAPAEREISFGAERLDSSRLFGLTLGFAILAININVMLRSEGLSFMTLNFINLSLLALCFTFHGTLRSFLNALDQAIGGAAGILVQFPLYFGIMGLMSNSGLISQLSLYFSSISNAGSFPILSFFSAGLVNIFVPSGGGQWAIQGTILIETALRLDIPLGKAVMALAYGDQLTNMLQPFWALPLLAITKLKAREIIPYTLLIMLVGIVIFTSSLVIF
jgi:short-chain fatty acids transporter